MSMYDAIKNSAKEFSYELEIKNQEKLGEPKYYIVCGMGGSHLAADLLKITNPELFVFVHKNYGLPNLPDEILHNSLVIAFSYSGNTEETIDAYTMAKAKNIPCAAISTGGKLIELAMADGIPYIKMPDTGIQPRSATEMNLKALYILMGRKIEAEALKELGNRLDPEKFETEGKKIADMLSGRVPVIYSSEKNQGIAYDWKIKFNETGKIPAFYNIFSELNHNEMTGFDREEKTKHLSDNFTFIFLTDISDDPRIQKRMQILKKLYEDRALPVIEIPFVGADIYEKIFSSILISDWASYHTALNYNAESEGVPMVEEFKKLVS